MPAPAVVWTQAPACLGFRLAFSRRGMPTITPLWAPSVQIGQRWNLSASDITRVLKFYDCSPLGRDLRAKGE